MTPPPKKKQRGLGILIVVAVLFFCLASGSCLAAIAIPQFITYIRRSKTAEASANLANLYTGAAAYYSAEHWGGGVVRPGASAATRCAVGSQITSAPPTSSKSLLGPLGGSFDAIGFSLPDPVYFQYEIISAGGCDHAPGQPVYTFRAYGDLDGDGATSLYEVTATASESGDLVRSPGVHTVDEFE